MRWSALTLVALASGCDALLPTSDWTVMAHPCVANRTDALWFDDAREGWVGCGTGTVGEGLFHTSDGGRTWSVPPSPGDILDTLRVNHVVRAPDGVLYASGTAPGGVRIVAIDGADVSVWYAAPSTGAQTWQSFSVGTFQMDGTGRAVAESLTGSDVLYWPDTARDGTDGYGWWADDIPEGAQILDLEVHDGRFYGVGSTIAQPPYLFAEPEAGMGSSFALDATALSTAFDGEAWDLAIDDAGGMLIAGVNEDADVATAWVGDAGGVSEIDVGSVVGLADPTRFHGACRDGDRMLAVGDYSRRGDALAILSVDAGATWEIVTPPPDGASPMGPLTRCQFVGDDVVVAGADGFIGVLAP